MLSVTGHRAPKLGGYSPEATNRLRQFAYQKLAKLQPTGIMSGMFNGWDLATAEAGLELGIPVHCVIPFVHQASKWTITEQDRWTDVKLQAVTVKTLTGYYSRSCLAKLDRYLVDNATELLALWDTSSCGDSYCLKYARTKPNGPPIINCWNEWQAFQSPVTNPEPISCQ